MQLTSWGAAGQVTGSMHLLELENYKILIDCGLDYERDTRLEENEHFPFSPASIDLVILTHAHIDHTGNLPTLVRHGFEGQILCTPPTADLTELLLLDSVNIFLNKERKSRRNKRANHKLRPLYLQKHVMETVDRFVTIAFNKSFAINGDISVEFIAAGHLLGAASVILTIKENDTIKKIGFSGDVGRYNFPVLVDPAPLPQLDYLVCEATYGGRRHSKDKSVDEILAEVVNDACHKNPGRLIIPAFSIGRTQALVFSLNKLFSSGKVKPVKVFVDSPLANHATEVFRKYHSYVNDEAKEFYNKEGDEFEFENLDYIQNLNESKEIENYFEPCVIISSAGMLEGGRIQDHLFYNVSNYYCTILFIGYCAKGTLGNRLLRGDPFVRIRDRELSVYATIRQTDVLSGHADHDGLLDFIGQQSPERLKNLFLVHGEDISLTALQGAAAEHGYNCTIAQKGVAYQLS